ncbi:uncharacterized protein LOC119735978 [Patiria miniata]|uniref:Uncharacterized protein n=1 Tax=Patiria miniata TaxID=46514 RepID=A0A914AQG6_PATMI|nr:uncharacterized protein LOC119735978 [Patiria miniata]
MDTLFFKTRQGSNPFEDEPLPAAHYHPSLQKHISDTEKKINLSPERLSKHDVIGSSASQGKDKPFEKPSPAEREFLARANTMLAKELPTHDTPSPGNASSKFDESWPTSERPSTIESPGEYRPPSQGTTVSLRSTAREEPGATVKTQLSESSASTSGTDYLAQWRNRYNKGGRQPQQKQPAEGSTLAKYIQRFRYSEPRSRLEREREKQAARGNDFWWLAPPSRTSTPSEDDARTPPQLPTQGVGTRRRGRGGLVSPGRRDSAGSYGRSLSSVSPSERMDTDTDDLQTRAERLLERSESTILSEPAVSSNGVGVSSTTANYQEPDYFIGDVPRSAAQTRSFQMPPPMGEGQLPGKKAGLRPEDDILHQWRVRRRLEEARRQTVRRGPLTDASRGASLDKQTVEGSCLNDFRKRLRQHELLSHSRLDTLQTEQSKPLTKTTGTSPMPQTIATQTNGVLPSVGEDVPVRDKGTRKTSHDHVRREPAVTSRSHVHDLHDIYARPVQAADYQSGKKYKERPHASEMDENERRVEPIIASPSVRPTAGPIVPHLHMACDIIPCPDDRNPDEALHRNSERIRSDTADAPERLATGVSRASVTRQQASLHPASSGGDLPPRDDAQDHQKHLREQPAPYLSTIPDLSQPTKPTIKNKSDDDNRIPQRGHSKDDSPRQRLDFEEQARHKMGQRLRDSDGEFEGEVEQEIRSEGMQTPPTRGRESGRVHASSPIGAAVGQVISDRLFTTPDQSVWTPKSSIDSLPSMHSSMMSHTSQSSAPFQGRLDGEEVMSSASSSSDGEEFADDELLQLLRRRRAQYENQLQNLDRLIEMQTAGT